jgi:D-arabinose 1-dehydrogenase-like Zn-dependent alcohol dehydrogenase
VKAAVLHATRQPLSIEAVPDPVPGPTDVLVETRACGICGTDVHIQDGWGYTPDLPFVMGHEPSGVVAAVGKDVARFRPGDRVIPNIFFTCGDCLYCRTNRETQCLQLNGILGVLKHWGGYGAYFRAPARQVFHLPDAVSFTEGAIVADAVVTALHAVRAGRVIAGETVVVIGIGGCGGAAVQICTLSGARVIAVDVTPAKQAHALALGAETALIASQDTAQAILDLTEGLGAACVIDAVGSTTTLATGVDCLASGGRLVVLGYTQERYPLDPRRVAVRELEIIGVRSGGRQHTADALRLVADQRWKSIVSDRFPLEQVNEALALLRGGSALGRVVLTFA